MTRRAEANLGKHCVSELAEMLQGHQLATAESCTGGLLAQSLAQLAGSGTWFRGGLVAYQRDVKFELLGVTPGPVVTERAAREMAVGATELFNADAAVAITGAAGPDPHDGAEPGTVCIATVVDGDAATEEYHFDGTPAAVCEQARDAALRNLTDALRARRTA